MKLSILSLVVLVVVAGCGVASHPEPVRFARGETVAIEVQGEGVVTSPSGDVNCRSGVRADSRAGCHVDWTRGGSGVLMARPEPGWRFAGWQVLNADRDGRADPGFLAPAEGGQKLYRAIFVPETMVVAPPDEQPHAGQRTASVTR